MKISPLNTSECLQRLLRTSNFKKKLGKGGTPLRERITTNQLKDKSAEFVAGAPLGAPFSPPSKIEKEKKTPKYKVSNPFHPHPPTVVVKISAPRKNTEDKMKIFLICLANSLLILTRPHLKILVKIRTPLLRVLTKNKGMDF